MSLAFLVFGSLDDTAAVDPPCTRVKARNTFLAQSIALLPSVEVPHGVVREAIALWRTCASYGEGFPSFVALAPAGEEVDGRGEGRDPEDLRRDHRRRVTVRYCPGTGGGDRCGRFVGTAIELYDFMTGPDGRQRPCGSLAQNLAHELGHVLGLRDAPPGDECASHIMSLIDDGNADRRRVHDEECQAAGQMWLTPWEHEHRRDVLERLPGRSVPSPSVPSPSEPPPPFSLPVSLPLSPTLENLR